MKASQENIAKGDTVYERVTFAGRGGEAAVVKRKRGRVVAVHRAAATVQFDGEGRPAKVRFNLEVDDAAQRRRSAPEPETPLPSPPLRIVDRAELAPVVESRSVAIPVPPKVENALAAWLDMGRELRADLEQRIAGLKEEYSALDEEMAQLDRERDDVSKQLGALVAQLTRIDAVTGGGV